MQKSEIVTMVLGRYMSPNSLYKETLAHTQALLLPLLLSLGFLPLGDLVDR